MLFSGWEVLANDPDWIVMPEDTWVNAVAVSQAPQKEGSTSCRAGMALDKKWPDGQNLHIAMECYGMDASNRNDHSYVE